MGPHQKSRCCAAHAGENGRIEASAVGGQEKEGKLRTGQSWQDSGYQSRICNPLHKLEEYKPKP